MRGTADLLLVIAALLCAGTLGFGLCWLWYHRTEARQRREHEQSLWIAERMTRASIDLATHSGQSLADVERALAKAMMMGPHGAPWMRR